MTNPVVTREDIMAAPISRGAKFLLIERIGYDRTPVRRGQAARDRGLTVAALERIERDALSTVIASSAAQ